MGVVVRRYINIPTSLVLRSFLGSCIPISLFILKMFFRSCLHYFCAICTANVAQRTFKIVQKSRSRQYGDIIISTSMSTTSSETSTCDVPSDVLRKL